MLPLSDAVLQVFPVVMIAYANGDPVKVLGVPLIVIVFEDQEALTPAGKLDGVPIPVARVVVCVIFVKVVLAQIVGVDEGADAVLFGFTVIVPVAFTAVPQPPVKGME